MKVSLSWLKEHLDTSADAASVADRATRIGLEVEGIEDKAAELSAYKVARVISAETHPNADKLRVCMVDTGTETVQVVCGAPNAHAGMKGVFAPPGTYIPGSKMTLGIAKIRGVESRGMLCSERELELSNEHQGIIELKEDAVVGSPAAAALGLADPVLDVALTPNRGDCTSVYGIARDLAAADLGVLKGGAVAPVSGHFPSPIKTSLEFPAGLESACSMFAGRVIRGIKNGPSPEWLQTRLKAVGLRPISAVVDVTNFVAHDRGRPLHAFDMTKLKGNMRARLAKHGETILALDGKTYTLDEEMTVIADEVAARAIAGVMGGEESGCTEATTDVFLESALFDPVRTARTGRTLGIISDARYRFERGVDPEFVVQGLELATKLVLEFCGGEASEIVVAGGPLGGGRKIAFSTADVKRLGGLSLPQSEIVRILKKLGFSVSGNEHLTVVPPSWRSDVHGPADLVEEVVRIYGLDKVPPEPMKRPHAVAQPVLTPQQRRVSWARRALAARGFDETVHFSFVPRKHALLFGGGDEARQLANPISADLDALRPSVLPALLASAARNQARGLLHALLFEIGAQFESGMPGAQTTVAAGLRAGDPPRHWLKATPPDAFTAKADALAVLDAASRQPIAAPILANAAAWYHPGRAGTLALGPKVIGYFGELHPRIIAAFDLKGPVAGFEIFIDAIPEGKARPTKARGKLEASDLMPLERDFAFVLDAGVSADQVVKAARGAERALIERVDVFDVYEGKGIPEGKKSLAIAVKLQPKERTLTDQEIEAVAQKIVNAVAKATGGTLRS
ncbi:MAG TPA: phenylalanine--tRNA ligase subunit beta [Micropepsaceae bacterium]|nr:phenylalanine--tRNA ligase subunit beta [Micropepsaceae bacterium]